jgi:tetratricopeptide (TPR) repeat protein
MNLRFKFLPIALATLLCVLMASAARAQVNVHGQVMLAGGDLPRNPIGFDISSDDATYHDIRFTDSNGRFILERLNGPMGYTLYFHSDRATYGDTVYKFTPEYTDTPRIYLNAYVPPKTAKPATVSAAAAGNKPDSRAADLHDRGLQAMKDGHTDQALTLFQSAVDADPKYADAYNDLGVVQMRQKNYSAAEQSFRKGLDVDPKSPSLQANLGESLNHQKKYKDAIAPLQESVRLKPDFAGAHLQLGVACVETDDLVDGKRELELAQSQEGDKADSDAVLQLYLGDLYAQTGDFAKGIAALTQYLKIAPDAPNAAGVKSLLERMQQAVNARHQ